MLPKKKVVVVDDNETNAHLLEDYLTEQGYDVVLAFTGQDGLKTVTDANPDLVVLDLFLPDMKGSQVCMQLRARKATQHIPIILCTAHSISQSEKMVGFRAGVDDYLIRPFELSELSARMEVLLRRSVPHFQTEVLAGIDALLKMPPQPKPAPAPVTTIEKPAQKSEKMTAPSTPPTTVSLSMPTPADLQSFHPLQRMISILNHPYQTFSQTKQHEDLMVSLMLVLGTPMIANILSAPLFGSAAWLSGLTLKIGAHLGAWFLLAAVLQVAAPFLGKHWSFQRALSIAGLSWAPKALEATLAVFYAFVAPAFVARVAPFSAGLDFLHGSDRTNSALLSAIDVFSLWSVGILLMGVWTLCETRKKWNSITVTIALVALLCSMAAHV